METSLLIYFILLALLAEILGTVGGFGSSLFFVPIAGFFFDFYSVLGITALFHLSSNVSKIVLFRKGFDWAIIKRIGIPAVLFVIAGSLLSKYVKTEWLNLLLAAFLMVSSLVLLFFKNIVLKPNLSNSIAGGAASGFIAGLIGTGGAIRGLTLAAFNLKTEVFIATSAIIDLGVDFSRSVVYFSNGYIHRHDLYLVPILLVVSIVGTLIGKQILNRFSQNQFKTGVLILVFCSGVLLLIKAIGFNF